jgi:predicted phage tail protein
MRSTFTLLVLLLFSFHSFAQQKATVSGTITDESGKPLSSATVSLVRAKDSVLVKLAVSGNQGQFELVNIPQGSYRISVSLVGYAKQHSDIFQLTDADLKLPSMVLPSQVSTGEVTVTAKKPFVESKIDRTVVNVEASPSSAGATAMDILEKSPGITVNSDGGISLRGKAGVIVMLDGKPTYLSA